MKKMRYFLGFILITIVMFIAISCSQDVPTYTTDTYTGCNKVEETHIKVLVCDATQTNYFGGAEVFVYLSEDARTNDPGRTEYAYKATTDNSDPINVGAVFYKTPYQHYWFFARKDLGGGNFLIGTNDGYPKMCTTKPFVVVVQ